MVYFYVFEVKEKIEKISRLEFLKFFMADQIFLKFTKFI